MPGSYGGMWTGKVINAFKWGWNLAIFSTNLTLQRRKSPKVEAVIQQGLVQILVFTQGTKGQSGLDDQSWMFSYRSKQWMKIGWLLTRSHWLASLLLFHSASQGDSYDRHKTPPTHRKHYTWPPRADRPNLTGLLSTQTTHSCLLRIMCCQFCDFHRKAHLILF